MNSEKLSLRKYAAVIAILLVLVMTVLDVTLVNVALPVLARDFNISDSATVWIVTIYQLAITMLLLPLSSFGELHGYKRNFLIGVTVFTLASAMCAISRSFTLILIARALQGIGASCVMSVNVALTRMIYPRNILGRGLALNAMVIAIATAAGPTIAGAILSIASWHWLFIINIPLGIIAFLMGYKLLPANPTTATHGKFDLLSGIMNAIVFGLIFYSLGNFARKGDNITNIILLSAGLALGWLYFKRQTHRKSPMLPVDLFRIRLYSLSIFTSVCSFIAQNMAMISLPFLFLNNFGFSEITTGLLMTPWPLATMIVSPIAARFVERHNPGLTAAAGMAVYSLGVVLLIFLPENASEINIAFKMALCGIGFGLFQTPNNIVMVLATPIQRTGSAGGMQSTARLVGQTLGASLVTLVFAFSSVIGISVHTCLWFAIIFASAAAILSVCRSGQVKDQRLS